MKLNRIIYCIPLMIWNLTFAQNTKPKIEVVDSLYNIWTTTTQYAGIEYCDCDYQPYYKEFHYAEFNNWSQLISGALCINQCCSKKLALLTEILVYMQTGKFDNEYLYTIVDSSDNRIFDIIKYNCGAQDGKIDHINIDSLHKFSVVFDNLLDSTLTNNTKHITENEKSTPIHSEYHLIKEIGFCNHLLNEYEIGKIGINILSDSMYMEYFIKAQNLHRFFENRISGEIIAEITILAMVNAQTPFTNNIFLFKLESKKIISNMTLLSIIMENLSTTDYLTVLDLLSQNGYVIVLK